MSHLVAPSILAANFGILDDEISMINESEGDWIHCDIMDGRFVPNISFGFPILKSVKKIAQKPLDVHLMIVEPEKYFEAFKNIGADHISFHWEATVHPDRNIHAIHEMGMKAGIALNPATSVEVLQHLLPLLDIVCLMSVNPGFGGQKVIPYVLQKVSRLKEMIQQCGSHTLIEIDGGVNFETGKKLLEAGADVLVAGSFVFKASNPIQTIHELKALDGVRRYQS